MPAQEKTVNKVPEIYSSSEDKNSATDPKKPEKELFAWAAPSRPFKRRDREFYVTIIAIAFIIGLILFFVEGVMPVILIISLIFLFYVLSTVEPESIIYKITNKGINVAGRETTWEFLSRFWFSKRFNSTLLVFETTRIPGRLELVVNASDKDDLRKVISKYISEEEAPPSFLDKSANWFSKRLPGN
jgi:hypothetical protein